MTNGLKNKIHGHNMVFEWSFLSIFPIKTVTKWGENILKRAFLSKSLCIDKSRGEVSLVEQNTIDYVSTTYFEPKKITKDIFCP